MTIEMEAANFFDEETTIDAGSDVAVLAVDEELPGEPEATTELVEPDNDDKYFRHLDLLAQMAHCERERRAAASELTVLQEDIKDAKKKLDHCVLDMQEIASDIADLMDGTKLPDPKPVEQAKIESQPTTPESTEWRKMSTIDLLGGTKGLGKKKLESLCDLAPTVGELEDLRGQASRAFKSFKEMLPAGFGDKVASEIEDQIIEHVAKFANPPASEQVKENAPAVDDDLRMELEDFAAEKIEEIRNEAKEIEWTQDDCIVSKNGECSEMARGYNDFEANKSSIDFPADFITKESVELWCEGWVAAERCEFLAIEKEKADDLSDL